MPPINILSFKNKPAPQGPQDVSKCSQDAPQCPNMYSRCNLDAPRCRQDVNHMSQRSPQYNSKNNSKDIPKILPRYPPDIPEMSSRLNFLRKAINKVKHWICYHDHTRVWGGSRSVFTTPQGFFLPCFKPICLALVSPKTNFVFTLNFRFHIYFNLFEPLDVYLQLLVV